MYGISKNGKTKIMFVLLITLLHVDLTHLTLPTLRKLVIQVNDRTRDPRTAWSAHRSVRVGAIFFVFLCWCGAVLRFQNFIVRCGIAQIPAPAASGALITGSDSEILV